MDKKVPIKRSKNLIWLSRDHHDALLIVWKIRQGIRLAVSNMRMENFVANAFQKELEPHFVEEEGLLFAKLAADHELRLRAEEEHAGIRKMAAVLQPGTEATVAALEAFCNLLEAHIRFEVRVLFPYIEQEISPEELDLAGNRLEAEHLIKEPFVWKDEFWVKKKA